MFYRLSALTRYKKAQRRRALIFALKPD